MQISGPTPVPFYGNYLEIARLGYLECISKWTSEFGATFVYYLGITPLVVTSDPEVIKSIMVKNFDSFVNRPFGALLIKKGSKNEELTFMEDEDWWRVRRTLAPVFTSKRLRMMTPLIEDCCHRLKNRMTTISNGDNTVEIWEWFGPYIMEVILATEFSRDISTTNGEESPLAKAASSIMLAAARNSGDSISDKKLQTILSHFPWCKPIMKYFARQTVVAQNFDCLEETAIKLIEDRSETFANTRNATHDLLQFMLEAHDENKETKSKRYLRKGEVVGSVNTFMLASYDTIRGFLSYTVYLLALNPTIQDKLTHEINEYYDTNPASSLYDAAENIEYITMVLYESMRLYPPTPDAHRRCNKTCAVNDGLVILQNCVVCFPFYSLHQNPEHWQDPNTFDPERFNPNKEQQHPTYAYLPFGEGPRHCIGKRLALLVAKMSLVAMLKDFQFRQTMDTEVPLKLTCGFTAKPKNGIYLAVVANS